MATIQISKGLEVLVDDEDFPELSKWRWFYHTMGYASRQYSQGGVRRSVLMHRQIMNPPVGMVVDHINGNKLDNRRENLRVVTQSENNFNARKPSRNKSGFKGVYWEKQHNRWIAQTIDFGKRKVVGFFLTAEEAAEAYDTAARATRGDIIITNGWRK